MITVQYRKFDPNAELHILKGRYGKSHMSEKSSCRTGADLVVITASQDPDPILKDLVDESMRLDQQPLSSCLNGSGLPIPANGSR